MKLYTPSKIQRRLGERLFLKPERDLTQKSAMVRRPNPPGVHGRRSRRKPLSDYGAMLREKQKVRFSYLLTDTALRKYLREALSGGGLNPAEKLFSLLELRLDNILYRLGFALSRLHARHLVSYGHAQVNGKPTRIPSRRLKPGDRVQIRGSSRTQPFFHEQAIRLKSYEPPSWLSLDRERWEGEVLRLPKFADETPSFDLDQVIAYYSR